MCYGVVRDPHAAADISQEVFIKAYLSIGSYQNQGFKTWISRISINKSIDYVRKMAKEQANCTYQEFPTSASQSLEEQSQEPTHHETPESVFFKKILREEINNACNNLKVYGTTIPLSSITNVYTLDYFPRIITKTNGLGFGSTHKGSFNLEGLGASRLYISSEKSPFLYIEQGSYTIIINFSDSKKTYDLFTTIKTNWGK